MRQRVLVVGPGALGIIAAVRLQQAGHNVTMAARTAAKAKRFTGQGFVFTDKDGEQQRAMVPTIHAPKKADCWDVIIFATKAQAASDVATTWASHLAEDGVAIPFYNGLMGSELRPILGDHYVECSVWFPATLVDDGVSHETGVGEMVTEDSPRGQRAAALLDDIVPTSARPDIESVKWTKLSLNSTASSLGIVTGEGLAGMFANKAVRRFFLANLREGFAVMEGQGIAVAKMRFAKLHLLQQKMGPIAGIGMQVMGRKYRSYQSSGRQSIQRGQASEVDYLNRVIVEAGAAAGVPTPCNSWLLETVKSVEAGELEAGVGLVDAAGLA